MSVGYTDTPLISGQKWRVHDAERPKPQTVTPTNLPEISPVTPPGDATVLFDGSEKTAKNWVHAKDERPLEWQLVDGQAMEVVKGTGDIKSTQGFGDMQLHLEFRCPEEITGDSQQRGNSGVFIMDQYEIQVLDSYDNPSYADGMCGGIYGQTPPMVNACCPPGQWHVYDILWQAPRFQEGKLTQPAFVTVIHNGVVLHHAQTLQGPTRHQQATQYNPHESRLPIRLQDHGDAVRFRNIWVRDLEGYEHR